MYRQVVCVFLVFELILSVLCDSKISPNIITILADDLGWNDVSFHGSNQIPTPNIDALAYNGIILNSHYVQPLCTPSRAAFLTGKYPIHTGMQHSVILEMEPRGLPLKEKLLPEYLREAGYSTHAVGKWHLGFFRREYTPTYRGFDSHYGYWNGFQDYFNQSVIATFNKTANGLDLRRNMEVDYKSVGKYSTHLYTEEAVRLIERHNTSKPMFLYMAHLAPHTGNVGNAFQAPDEDIAKFSHIVDPERRVYAAMVSVLDQSVGEIMSALRRKKMLDNSIVLFIADNGAPTHGLHSNRGSNYPLRGQKDSPWEGGTRGVAAVWSPLFKNMKRVSNELIHISDWLPTFWNAIGRDFNELGNIDGLSMWDMLTDNKPSPRNELVVNMDELFPYESIRFNEWKYVRGAPSYGDYDEWYGEPISEDGSYETEDILFSKTGIAITGYITDKQMFEKNNNNGSLDYSIEPLQASEISMMRSSAVINCTNMVVDENCNPRKAPCLFNIKDDPCETKNLADKNPILLASIQDLVNKYQLTVMKPSNMLPDPNASPLLHENIWSNWKDEPEFRPFDNLNQSTLIGLIIAFVIIIIVIVFFVKMQCHKRLSRKGSMSKIGGSGLFRPFSVDSQRRRSHAREAAMTPTISVAQRVEMYEDRDNYKTRI